MSRADFCACHIDEFEAIAKAWMEREENHERQEWERLRTLAAITIQPHIRKKLTARQLMPLPWDRPERKEEKLTMAERKKRAAEAARKLGAKTY